MTSPDLPRRTAYVIGTRGSALALAQTRVVRERLTVQSPRLTFSESRIRTIGDERQDVPLSALGAQGVFVTAIEHALRDGRVDLAVHSAKDLPSRIPADMRLVAFLEREDARDVLVSRCGSIDALPGGARVGTSSPRRAWQIRKARPDVALLDLRGNVDTRLAKLDRGDYDAIVLAAAGLIRLGLAARITEWLSNDVMLPMVGQGAIAVEARAGDEEVASLAAALNHRATSLAVTAERAFLARLGAGCTAVVGAYAVVDGDRLYISGLVGSSDGKGARATLDGLTSDAERLGAALADQLSPVA